MHQLELSFEEAMATTMTIIQAPAGPQVQQASLVELGMQKQIRAADSRLLDIRITGYFLMNLPLNVLLYYKLKEKIC